ncbi:MAG: phytanoyl-CoA dioxygenase, partial [Actinomycetota bacterium]
MKRAADCRVDDLAAIVDQVTLLDDYPLAHRVDHNVLIYSAAALVGADREQALTELARALSAGPGVIIVEAAMSPEVVDRATGVFFEVIDEQHRAGQSVGDHFAKPGANDRIWTSLEKLAITDSATFVDYHLGFMSAA